MESSHAHIFDHICVFTRMYSCTYSHALVDCDCAVIHPYVRVSKRMSRLLHIFLRCSRAHVCACMVIWAHAQVGVRPRTHLGAHAQWLVRIHTCVFRLTHTRRVRMCVRKHVCVCVCIRMDACANTDLYTHVSGN